MPSDYAALVTGVLPSDFLCFSVLQFVLVSFNKCFKDFRHFSLVRQVVAGDDLGTQAFETQESEEKRKVKC